MWTVSLARERSLLQRSKASPVLHVVMPSEQFAFLVIQYIDRSIPISITISLLRCKFSPGESGL